MFSFIENGKEEFCNRKFLATKFWQGDMHQRCLNELQQSGQSSLNESNIKYDSDKYDIEINKLTSENNDEVERLLSSINWKELSDIDYSEYNQWYREEILEKLYITKDAFSEWISKFKIRLPNKWQR